MLFGSANLQMLQGIQLDLARFQEWLVICSVDKCFVLVFIHDVYVGYAVWFHLHIHVI